MFFTPMWNWLKQQSRNSKRNRRRLRSSHGQHRLFLEALEDRTLLTAWTAIGPAPLTNAGVAGDVVSGRIAGIAADPTDANTIYIAAAGGGVWKTTDGGTNWSPLTDSQKTLSMGAIAIAPSDNQVIYAGTGEANNSLDSNYGEGILVSTDGGTNWTLDNPGGIFTGLTVSKIAVDPTNSDIAYAAMGNVGANKAFINGTGIYKTTDGGANWTNVTAGPIGGTNLAFSDIVIDPTTSGNSATLYAALGPFYGNSLSGVYKSINAGATWSLLSNLPSGASDGRIALTISPSNPSVLYAAIANNTGVAGGGLYKLEESTDGGNNWTDRTAAALAVGGDFTNGAGWYNLAIAVDPTNPAIVYAGGSFNGGSPGIIESVNSGAAWTNIVRDDLNLGPHTDIHAMTFDKNGNLLLGTDGGIFQKIVDPNPPNKFLWNDLNGNLNTIQFTGIAINPSDATQALGGSQDNGTELYNAGTGWKTTDGGDGGIVRYAPSNPAIVYRDSPVASFGVGSFFRASSNGGLNWTSRTGGLPANFANISNFYPPFAVDANNDQRVVLGSNQINQTTNGGVSWSTLTSTASNGWNPAGHNVDSIALAASDANTMYASVGGSFASSSQIFVSTNDGVNWIERDLLVGSGRVNQLIVDPTNAQTVYAVVSTFTGGGGHVWKTVNGGQNWTDISGNLPDLPTWSIQLDSKNSVLYVGTDSGVYVSSDTGSVSTTWSKLGTGLPNVQVFDLDYEASLNLLGAGTHGRGMWEISTQATPVVNTISPSMGPSSGGTVVTITGSNFTAATAVNFGGTAATTFTVNSDSSITATSPVHIGGMVAVTVVGPGGTSTTGANDQFTFVDAPTITTISPSSGPTSGGTSVTITGTDFIAVTGVSFGGTAAATFTVNSPTSITATSPAESAGTVDIAITAIGGTSTNGAADKFTYSDTPSVSGITPSMGPTSGGTSVTITGTDFIGVTGVSFGGTAATTFTVNSPTSITATSPAESAGIVDITITAAGGTSASGTSDKFTYVNAPTVTGITPKMGPTSGGTSVTITGTDFIGVTGVSFGGTAATTFTVNSPTSITATSPAESAGIVDITVTAVGGTSTNGAADKFTYVNAPTITTISPSSGPTSGGTSVTITGTDFIGVTGVSFGGTAAATFTVNSPTSITATSPVVGSIGPVHITVTAAGGSSTNGAADLFTYFTPAPTVTTQPQSVTTSVGSSVLFTTAATGFPPPTVQWQVSTDGGATFHEISGAVNTSLFVVGITANMNGNEYRAVFTNSAGTATSNAAVLTVNSPPNVTTQPTNATAMAGNNASFTAAASGSPPPTVQWQVSTNGGLTFSNYGGATSPTLNLTSVTTAMNGWRFRAVFSNTFGVATSNAATLTVTPAPMGPIVTTQPTSLSVAAGASATFTAAASGSPAPTVQWRVSTDHGATFSNLSGATSTTLTLPSVTGAMNGNQYYAVFTNSQGIANTNIAILSVSAVPIAPTITTQPLSVAVASSGTATFTAAASGIPAPTVQWQVSINGGLTFSNLSGANSPTLNLQNVSVGMNNYKYRAVFTNSAGTAISNAATLSVNVAAIAPSITLNPTSQAATAGSMVQLTASASGTPVPSVQWQVSTDGGATFNNLSGATTATLLLNGVTGAMNGNQYRAVFTNSAGSATTLAATLTVNVPPSITTQPANAAATAGNSASFTAAASGLPLPTVQWQVSTNGGATYTNIGAATTLTLNLPAVTTAMNGNKYRAVFTNAAGTITSSAATLTVNGVPAAPVITASPASQTVLAGTTVTFAASASGTPAPTVQWQVSTDGGATFSNLSGATSTTLPLPSVTVALNGNQYRAVFTNSQGSATTSAATLSVSAVPIAPTITTQPLSVAVASGGTATFTAAASGTPTPTVQWQVSINGGLSFTNISGATNPMLTVPNVSVLMNNYKYRAVFTNSAGSAISNAATLSVTGSTAAPVVTTNPQNVTTTAGASVFFTAAATGTPAPTVQWQVSINGGFTFIDIPGATNTWLLLFGILASMNGYQYRAVFTNSAGATPSNAAILTVI